MALLMPVISLGGIYAGIFTPTESASVACVYALIVSAFVYKELDLKKLYKIHLLLHQTLLKVHFHNLIKEVYFHFLIQLTLLCY